MSLLIASLYLLVIAGLFGSAAYVVSRDPFSRLNRAYCLLALAQLAWVGTLFVFNTEPSGSQLLLLGRTNFAAAALVPPALLLFVRALLAKPIRHMPWFLMESLIVVGVSLGTGLVDRSESVTNGVHVTAYGLFFGLYVIHLLTYLVPAILLALNPGPRVPELLRRQARLVGIGVAVTAVTGIASNVAIPYLFNDFRFINIGTLATMAALAAIAYSACFQRLFNLRLVVRATLVYAILVGFALEVYQVSVSALAKMLPLGNAGQRTEAATAVTLVVNAVTQPPLRLWLQHMADRIERHNRRVGATSGKRQPEEVPVTDIAP